MLTNFHRLTALLFVMTKTTNYIFTLCIYIKYKSYIICILVGDGRKGYSQDGPYNAIHVGAAAPSLPQSVSI